MRKTWPQDLLALIWPFPRMDAINKKIATQPSESREQRRRHWVSLGRDKLLVLIQQERDRARDIEDKLYKLTAALTVGVTIAGVIFQSIMEKVLAGWTWWLLFLPFAYAVASMLMGVREGFSGLTTAEHAGYGADFALQVQHDDVAAAESCASALAHYEAQNLIRSNRAYAAGRGVRNGIAAFALAMVLSPFVPSKPQNPTASGQTPIESTERNDAQTPCWPGAHIPLIRELRT